MSGAECHRSREEDHMFLHSILMEKKLHMLFKIHERLKRFEKRSPIPIQEHAASLGSDLVLDLGFLERGAEVTELVELISKPHFKSLLWVHDTVAQRDYEPALPSVPDGVLEEDDDDEDSVKIVSLVKTQEPLGATIKRDESTGAIVVARIMIGGAAARSGLIHEGDELREVNGVSVENKKPREILPLLALSKGDVTFKVIPALTKEDLSTNKKGFVRALFDYDPREDPAVPCKEAALSFKRGNVLQIVSREDDTWWQACHHADGNTHRAGLIPSQQLHERRVALQRPQALFASQRANRPTVMEDADYGSITGLNIAALRRSFRLGRTGSLARREARARRRRSGGMEGLVAPTTTTPTYMEVVPYRRDPKDKHRLVLLLGPSGVGVTELMKRLLLSDPEHYGVAIPYTTREKRRLEKDGMDYHFISQQMFEEDIISHRFVEYGRYRGHYYGIRMDSVLQVIAENKVCLLDVQPNVVQRLYTAEFKPYVVFVKPPRIEELRFTRRRTKFISDAGENKPARIFSEEDFEDMISSADAMDSQHGHLFDKVVVNGDVSAAFKELRADLQSMEEAEVQWLPAGWLHASRDMRRCSGHVTGSGGGSTPTFHSSKSINTAV